MKLPSFWHWLLAVAAVIISYDFVRVPFTNDVSIFMGVEHIADRYYPFPQGIDLAWEAKPIGNRLINYLILKAAQVFVPFEDHVSFEIAAKLIVLLLVIAVSLWFAHRVGGEYTGWLVFLTFTSCINFCIMQAEYYAVLLSVLTVATIIHDSCYSHMAGGVLIFFIATIKGITLFLLIPVLCGAYLLGKLEGKALAGLSVGFVVAGMAAVLLQLTVWPNMLPDLLLAPFITGMGRIPVDVGIQYFVIQSVFTTWYIPILLPGLLGAVLLVAGKKFTGWNLAAFAAMWLVPAAMIFIHSEYFAYQFFVYVLPALVTVILCQRYLKGYVATVKNPKKRRIAASLIPLALLWMLACFAVLTSFNGTMTDKETHFVRLRTNYTTTLIEKYHIDKEPSVLYLDDGVAPYWFRANSSGRYISPLPLQRSGPGWDLSEQTAYRRTLADAMAYNGKYVIGDGTFGSMPDWLHLEFPDRAALREKLERDYAVVWTQGWTVWQRRE